MDVSLRIVIIVALTIYYICIFYLLRKKSLTLKYTLLWIFAGLVMILIVAFPSVFERIIHSIGIVEMTNGLFAVVLFAILIILISITSIVSKMNSQMRQLVQQCALYEYEIRRLKEKTEDNESK
jgi:hypothetical protein